MAKARRFFGAVGLLIVTLGCVRGPIPATATPTPSVTRSVTSTATASPAYLGQFDCYGLEAGVRAYTGRVSLEPDGTLTFADQSGQWTYDPTRASFAFSGATDLGDATYQAADDTLVVQVRAGSTVAHAEGGRMDCVRAQPGITGP